MQRSATILLFSLVAISIVRPQLGVARINRLPFPTNAPSTPPFQGNTASNTLPSLLPQSFGQSQINNGKIQVTTIISTIQNRTVTIIGQ